MVFRARGAALAPGSAPAPIGGFEEARPAAGWRGPPARTPAAIAVRRRLPGPLLYSAGRYRQPRTRGAGQPSGRHLIEQPTLGSCTCGPRPVSAIRHIASNSSRRASAAAGSRPLASSRPRYCSCSAAL